MKNLIKVIITFSLVLAVSFATIGMLPQVYAQEKQTVNLSVQNSEEVYDFLANYNKLHGVDVYNEYKLNKVVDVAYGKIYKLLQISGEYEVYGGELDVSVDKNGKVLFVDGEYIKIPKLVENISESQAIEIVNQINPCVIYSIKKIIFGVIEVPELAYSILTNVNGGTRYIISAKTGDVLLQNAEKPKATETITQLDDYGNNIEIAVEHNEKKQLYIMADNVRNLYLTDLKGDTEYMMNNLAITDDGVATFDTAAVSAWDNLIKTYEFYTNADNIGVSLYGISGNNDDIANNALANKEVTIRLYIHYGRNYDNAYCSYNQEYREVFLVFGDGSAGDPQQVRALDVIAHEYQHAVTSEVAELGFTGESGALHEAFSDIFGMLVEGKTGDDFWGLGEDCNVPGEYDRKMGGGTPGQRYTMDEKYECTKKSHIEGNYHDGSCDSNGVHYNCTIITYLQYQISQLLPEYFTNQRIGKLWYSTLCALNTTSDFRDFAINFMRSAICLGYSEEAIEVIRTVLTDSTLLTEDDFHTVTFVDYDDSVIAEYSVFDGESLTKQPQAPTREEDVQYTYEFTGWDKEVTTVTEDIVVKAIYQSTLKSYAVKLYDSNGALISTSTHDYGYTYNLEDVEQPVSPGENWHFRGWFEATDTQHENPITKFTVSGEKSLHAYWEYIEPPPPPKKSGCKSTIVGESMGVASIVFILSAVLLLSHNQIKNKKSKKD
ncbi:MAG: M4 family metallopeptidase [Clostridiales bacterium]|nr:M4 family metallopeptidase [Clostridiales bacterium]